MITCLVALRWTGDLFCLSPNDYWRNASGSSEQDESGKENEP